MRSILEELYMGDTGFDVQHYSRNPPFVRAARQKLDNMETLQASLDEGEIGLFEQYCDAQSDMESITRYGTYASALRFDILLMMEMFMEQCDMEGSAGVE